PRSVRGEIELLGPGEAREYMHAVRARTERVLKDRGVGDGFVCEMVIRHELQHSETMRQTLAMAGLLPDGEPPLGAMGGADGWLRVPAGAFAMGASPEGFASDNERPRDTGPGSGLESVGRVWAWTQSSFGGYPIFVAHPYREYSEVFFGERYRVLRGGSWATDARVASPTFRNWDLPERRQIFAGVRL